LNQVQTFQDPTAPHDAKSNRQAAQAKRMAMSFGSDSSVVFTERGIAAYAPRTSGVYGIFNQMGCIYVGAAQDLEASLYSHLRGGADESYWIRRQKPTYFAFEQCDEKTRNRREMELIAELNPVCNRN
jgi:predicted GIY-YIG superfamily endonuclease